MWEIIKTNVLLPGAGRLGSLSTGALIGIGANSTHADWVGTGIAGAILIGTDLLLSWLRKRSIVDRTFKQVIEGLFPDGKP